MTTFTIGIDIGTTGTKLALFDCLEGVVCETSRESQLFSPQPGWAEADPIQWLENTLKSISWLLTESGIDATDVKAISASGMVPAVILLGADDKPLRRAILQNDARAVEEIAFLSNRLGNIDLVSETGSALTQQSVAPTLMWLANNEPEILRQTKSVVGSYDWILTALGARSHIERNWAIESGLYSLDGQLVVEVLDAARGKDSWLPDVVEPGTVVGGLSAEVAKMVGLRPGTSLVVGGADHVLSAFAAGAVQPSDWLVKLGGAGDILVVSDKPQVDQRLYLDAHPIPGLWLPNGCMATSGSLIRWFQNVLGGASLVELDLEAEKRAPSGVLCLPYFLGEKSPLHDPDLRGAFAGLHLGHDRADLYRSILEAIAFGFRHHVEVFEEIGIELGRVSITNGGSKSRLWKQIHAEILGVDMFPIINHPGASFGACLIAAIGIGILPGWDAVSRFVEYGEPVVPNPENVEVYAEAYQEWRNFGSTMTPTLRSIARRARQ